MLKVIKILSARKVMIHIIELRIVIVLWFQWFTDKKFKPKSPERKVHILCGPKKKNFCLNIYIFFEFNSNLILYFYFVY